MAKYRKLFDQMVSEHRELFDQFRLIHDAYVLNPVANQAKFNDIGASVMEIVQDYEHKLCGHMSRGQYGKFAGNVSEKFMDEVKKVFPKIMFVGIT